MARQGAYAKGIAKREEILTAALDVVARQGYGNASLRDLAEAVGLTQAGVLHYFDSKEELYTEVLRKRDEVDSGRIPLDSPADGPEVFLEGLRRNVGVPGLMQLYVHMAAVATEADGPAHDFFTERYERFRSETAASVHEMQKLGMLGPDADAEAAGRIIMAIADGLQNQWLLDPTFDIAGLVRMVFSAFGLAPASGQISPE